MTRDEEIQAMTPMRIGVACYNVRCDAPSSDGLNAQPEPVVAIYYLPIGQTGLLAPFDGGRAGDPPCPVVMLQLKDERAANLLSFIHVN